jgi:hypothetical protein
MTLDEFLNGREFPGRLIFAKVLKRFVAHGGKAGLHTKGGAYNEKWAYHVVRLLGDAKRIAGGAEPVVWKEGGERAELMRIRSGEVTQEQVERLARGLMDAIEALKPWPLAEEGDREWLNAWLLRLRGI